MSIRSKLITLVFAMVRRRSGMSGVGTAVDDRNKLKKAVAKLRRFDRREPPRRFGRGRRITTVGVHGGSLHVATPTTGARDRVLLYVHGGGYAFGPSSLHWRMAASIADRGAADLAMLMYPRTPESDHRDTLAAASEAFAVLLESYPADGIVVAGDSAGGGLTAALLSELRSAGRPQPRAALLISPWLDVSMSNPAAVQQAASDVILDLDAAAAIGRWYAGDTDPTDPRVSPMFADTTLLAPRHIFVGTEEIFLADCREYAERCRAAGEAVTIREMTSGQHVAAIFPTPEGRIARAQMLALVDWP